MLRTRILTVVVATTGLLLAGGCVISYPWQGSATAPYELTADFTGVTSVAVVWRNGALKVRIDSAATQARVEGDKIALASSDAEAQAALADIVITLARDPNDAARLVLRMEIPPGTPTVYTADAELTLPAGVALTVNSDNSATTVIRNTGATTLTLSNGTVVVTEQAGDTAILTGNGRIEVESTQGNVTAQTVSGSVSVDAQPGINGTVTARTQNGGVTIRVPAAFAAALELEAGIGSVSADLADFVVSDLVAGPRRITATLNGGGGTITGITNVGVVDFGRRD